MTDTPIHDAATIILLRDAETRPKVLMGQRGAGAVFMPNKFVFPGGRMDAGDADIPLHTPIGPTCAAKLAEDANVSINGLVAGAIRELWEEVGLILGQPGEWGQEIPTDWQGYAATGHVPSGENLHFVFRAVTPPNRPRRFDARFFLASAAHLASDPDDFGAATDELSHIQWIALDEARDFDLPFITEVVLAEISAALPRIGAPETVPFFNNTDEQSLFQHLGGRSPFASVRTSKPAPEY